MGILDVLQKIIQYPQSAATGIAAFGTTPAGLARETTGDFDVLERGFRGGFRPSEITPMDEDASGAEQLFHKIGSSGTDLIYDPLNLGIGGASKVAGKLDEASKVGQALRGVGQTGKIGIKADPLAKAGQMGRRYYQGLMATGDPLSAIGAASLIGGGERAATSLIPAIARKLSQEAPEALAESALKGVPDEMGADVANALNAGRQPIGALNPGARPMGPAPIPREMPSAGIIPDEVIPPGNKVSDPVSALAGQSGIGASSQVSGLTEADLAALQGLLSPSAQQQLPPELLQELMNNPDLISRILRLR